MSHSRGFLISLVLILLVLHSIAATLIEMAISAIVHGRGGLIIITAVCIGAFWICIRAIHRQESYGLSERWHSDY